MYACMCVCARMFSLDRKITLNDITSALFLQNETRRCSVAILAVALARGANNSSVVKIEASGGRWKCINGKIN